MLKLSEINKSTRHYRDTTLFSQPNRICLLDFLGLDLYFITEYGFIWKRTNVIKNYAGILDKCYQPRLELEPRTGMEWVYIPDDGNRIYWYPISTLLGWAYNQQIDGDNLLYLPENIHTCRVTHYSKYAWSPTDTYVPIDVLGNGVFDMMSIVDASPFFKTFINKIE